MNDEYQEEYKIFIEENSEDERTDEICRQIEKKIHNKNIIIW